MATTLPPSSDQAKAGTADGTGARTKLQAFLHGGGHESRATDAARCGSPVIELQLEVGKQFVLLVEPAAHGGVGQPLVAIVRRRSL